MKHKDAEVWYIGRLRNNEFIKPENVLKDKTQALIAFEKVKNFQKSELSSHSFDSMSSDALESWILDYGHNPYVGLSIHSSDAERAYQSKMQNKQEAQIIDYRNEVIGSVKEEYEIYREESLKQDPENIFDDCHHIYFNREVVDFITSEENDLRLNDYKGLYDACDVFVLSNLWEHYLTTNHHVTSWNDIKELIKDFNVFNSDKISEAEMV